jgi:hypothetical protein
MTFTYDLSGGFTDLTRFRKAIGDTDPDAAIFQDEEINAYLVEYESWQNAAKEAVKYIIAVLTQTPDFKADWLQVDVSKALAAYRKLLIDLEEASAEAGGGSMRARAVHTYRADSDHTLPPYNQ